MVANISLLTIFLIFVVSSSTPTWATPITILPGSVANVRDHRGTNDVGAGVGHLNAFGAEIAPTATSTITAVQAGFTVGPRICAPTSSNPDGCFTATFLDLSRLGSWLLTFSSGPDAVSVATPTLAGASVVPLATNVSIAG